MKDAITFGLAMLWLGAVGVHCAACASPSQAGASAAEVTYTGELLRCVDDAKTLAESRACRQRVDAKWQITEREAGAR